MQIRRPRQPPLCRLRHNRRVCRPLQLSLSQLRLSNRPLPQNLRRRSFQFTFSLPGCSMMPGTRRVVGYASC